MRALALCLNSSIGTGDLSPLTGRALPEQEWLQTVVYTWLFTDARASDAEQPAWTDDAHGHWGDLFYPRSFGSLLWTLKRELLNQDTVLKAQRICENALKWLKDEGHVATLNITTERANASAILITVVARKANGNELTVVLEYDLNAA